MGALELDPSRTALVLLDYQNYNVHPDGYWSKAVPGYSARMAPAVARTVVTNFAAEGTPAMRRTAGTGSS